jgi:hypothetical protein
VHVAAELQMAAADVYRCGAEAVGGKHASDTTAGVEGENGEVVPVLLADGRRGDAETNAGNRQEICGGRGTIIDGHCNLANGEGLRQRGRQWGAPGRLQLRQLAPAQVATPGGARGGSGAYDNLP